ncbi:MAG TPA: glycoside hydrolase family 99-like domain-containing protein [Casimicrobiaceae bacterium]
MEPSAATPPARVIAFYLPQFHPIPENDHWWGKGFTEWTNVTRARPSFVGHYQPHLPADLGFYDLRLPEVLEQQAALASLHGIHGFCYHYYWFAGKRLLERPVEAMRASGRPDFPYCLCWANENWTRRWDGADEDVLIAQKPSPADDERFIRDLLPHLSDRRYIRVDGRPLILIYRVGVLPNPRATADIWREVCRREGIGEVYLCAAKTYDTADPALYGFDALVEFPPHEVRVLTVNLQVDMINAEFAGSLYDYREFVQDRLAKPEPPYISHPTVMPGWDNTARRPNLANVFINATPEIYEIWLRETVARVARRRPDARLVFVNAWNEWAEGAHLEPDQRYGRQYLLATRRALSAAPVAGKPYVGCGLSPADGTHLLYDIA